jgi:hypothetical protein
MCTYIGMGVNFHADRQFDRVEHEDAHYKTCTIQHICLLTRSASDALLLDSLSGNSRFDIRPNHRTDWSTGNAVDLYSGGVLGSNLCRDISCHFRGFSQFD